MSQHDYYMDPDCTCENCRKYTITEKTVCAIIAVASIAFVLFALFNLK